MSDQNRSTSFLNNVSLRTAAFGVSIIVGVLCLLTTGQTFGFIDSGEMSAAATILGIPHPTGYPLLMLLGRVATILIPGPESVALNIFAALMVAAGSGVLVLVFHNLLGRLRTKSTEELTPVSDSAENGTGNTTVLYAMAAALLTALTPIWWAQGTIFEAYALHALMLPLVLLSFLHYLDTEERVPDAEARRFRISRAGVLFSFVLGLSFTNHMTTILLAPALLTWFFMRLSKGALSRLVMLVPGFLLGLLPYLYLPIRSAANPALNWGKPTSMERFFNHVTGVQFEGLMGEFSVFGKQISWYFASIPGELAYLGLILAIIGIVVLVRRFSSLAIFSGLLFLACLLYAGTYAIKDIEPYFLTATVAVGFWVAVGLWWLGERFGKVLPLAAAGLAIVLSAFLHWGVVNRSDHQMAEDLARNMLESLPENSVLFTTRWDLLYSGITYLQLVDKVRPDVSLVNVSMLADRVYLSQVLERNPSFAKGKDVNNRIRAFVNERKRADMSSDREPEDGKAYATKFYRMVNGIIATCGRPVFVTAEVEAQIGWGWTRHPYHLALRVMSDSAYLPQEPFSYAFTLPSYRLDPDVMGACQFYAGSLIARSQYERNNGKEAKWAEYLEQAKIFDPGIDPDDVSILPMGNQQYMRKGARYFKNIQASGVGK